MQRAALLVLVAACGGSQVKEHAPELTKNLPATLEADRPRTGDDDGKLRVTHCIKTTCGISRAPRLSSTTARKRPVVVAGMTFIIGRQIVALCLGVQTI